MTDTNPEIPRPDGVTADTPRPRVHTRWYHHWKMILLIIILAPMLVFGMYTCSALKYTYSEGDRAGTLQKFSRKGWLCKTWEGELMQPTAPGVAPTVWTFSVRSDSIAQLVDAGLGKRVVLHYREHRGVPTTCFGETQYYVDGIRTEQP